MTGALPRVYLARHGETAWTVTGRHTGVTDLPLTERGEENARRLGKLIGHEQFAHILVSPLKRTWHTCELAGFAGRAQVDPELIEWNYGDYEGLTTAEIREKRPDWIIYRDGCPGGERTSDVARRADRVIARVRAMGSKVLLFSSGHFLRVLGARWLGLEPSAARFLLLTTATLSIVGYEHTLCEPVICLWNDDRHVCE